ncbi:MAG: hypothetical protein J3Q66DRAFT_54898 [Benniella sp.]|nr:MAG: hypothetical protein J3Q66DRAFT_54898 [Benniella sp.]
MPHSYTKVSTSDQNDTGPATLIYNSDDMIEAIQDDDHHATAASSSCTETTEGGDVESGSYNVASSSGRTPGLHQRLLEPFTLLASYFSSSATSKSLTSAYTRVAVTSESGLHSSSRSSSSSSSPSSPPSSLSSTVTTSTPRTVRPSTSDGVFANIAAKPEVENPKDREQHPPTYDSAVQDVTPPYFEMTMISSSRTFGDEILIEGLPLGNIFHFLWNVTVATSFQFLGVLLTYLLHNSHASKAGSIVGLGITLLNFGIQMGGGLGALFRSDASGDAGATSTAAAGEITMDDTGYVSGNNASEQMNWFESDIEDHWVSLILIIAGWMVIVKALTEYAAKRKEVITQSRLAEDMENSSHSNEYDV